MVYSLLSYNVVSFKFNVYMIRSTIYVKRKIIILSKYCKVFMVTFTIYVRRKIIVLSIFFSSKFYSYICQMGWEWGFFFGGRGWWCFNILDI